MVMVMVVLVVMMATAAAFLVVMVMVVLVVVVAAAAILFVFVVVMMLVLQFLHGGRQGRLTFHGLQQLRTGQLTPGGYHDGGIRIMLPQQGHSGIQLGLGNGIGAGKDDGTGGFHLVIVELAEILHIHLYLAAIHNRHGKAQLHIGVGDLLHRSHHIAELANAGGLDDNSFGCILGDDLFQRLAKIAHQAAADAAGIHFGNIDASILQEAAVDADLTKFVFDQHQLLARIGLLDHFLDQRGLAGAQEAGIDINFRHWKISFAIELPIFYHIAFHFSTIFEKNPPNGSVSTPTPKSNTS